MLPYYRSFVFSAPSVDSLAYIGIEPLVPIVYEQKGLLDNKVRH